MYADGTVRLDGPIKSDFWTMLCSFNPIVASIVNFDERSFNSKIQIGCFKDVLLAGNVDVVLDTTNWVPSIIKNRVIAPFIHIGGSYMSAMHFDADEYCPELVSRISYLNSFYSNSFGPYAAHYCIVNMLCENDIELAENLRVARNIFLNSSKSTELEFLQFKREVEHCYRIALTDYI